jgi:hypothetical protein
VVRLKGQLHAQRAAKRHLPVEDVNLTSPSLNFIAAESILAPVAAIADIKTVYTPYDIVPVGDLKTTVT